LIARPGILFLGMNHNAFTPASVRYPIAIMSFLVTLLNSCETKTTEVIRNDNLTEVLTRYGKENPETNVLIETDYGNIRLKLYEDTPLHRANFIKLIKDGHFEDAEFYRIFYQFMIQGGDADDQLNYMIPSEFNKNYIHKKGALSMARQDEDNPELKSSSTEFFIVHGSKYADYQVESEIGNLGLSLTDEQKKIYMTDGGYMSLDQQYTVFGEITEGMEVVDKIASVKVYNEDKPVKKIPFKISVLH
jgi:cyclophilin family peptidyl-prolyl cis-trans isomerase